MNILIENLFQSVVLENNLLFLWQNYVKCLKLFLNDSNCFLFMI